MITDEHGRWDFYYTTFRHKRLLGGMTREEYWADRGGLVGSLELPADLDLLEAIDEARLEGLFGTGTSQVGVYEIQTPRGVYTHERGFYNLAHAKPTCIVFKSWAQLEAEETNA